MDRSLQEFVFTKFTVSIHEENPVELLRHLEGAKMESFDNVDDLVAVLKERRWVLKTNPPTKFGTYEPYEPSVEKTEDGKLWLRVQTNGLGTETVGVPEAHKNLIVSLVNDDTSDLRRLSDVPIVRTFVYFDISDFTKIYKDNATQRSAICWFIEEAEAAMKSAGSMYEGEKQGREAALCVGDGYIFVFKEAYFSVLFACTLATQIEMKVSIAATLLGEGMHFRAGIHVGEVCCIWDRKRLSDGDEGGGNWNYIGEGINGSHRVLSVIRMGGIDVDDVIYMSGEARAELMSRWPGDQRNLVEFMRNQGRRKDKHDRAWRVYEIDHQKFYWYFTKRPTR